MATSKPKSKTNPKTKATTKAKTKPAAKPKAKAKPKSGGFFRSLFAGLRPSRLIVELTATAVCLVVVGAVAVLAVNQVRHWTDPEFRFAQADRRDFYCARHGADASAGRADSVAGSGINAQVVQTRQKLEDLLEQARLRSSPTDPVGKFEVFFLCASVTKASLNSLEVVSTLGDGTVVRAETVEELAEVGGRLDAIARAVPEYPSIILAAQTELLRDLKGKVEAAVPEVQKIVPNPQPGARWLLVAGADQTDAAALDQVQDLQALLNGLDAELKEGAMAQVYRIRSWRRTVVPFQSEADAKAALEALGPKLRYGGYVRAEDKWCPNRSELPSIRDGVDGPEVTVTKCNPAS